MDRRCTVVLLTIDVTIKNTVDAVIVGDATLTGVTVALAGVMVLSAVALTGTEVTLTGALFAFTADNVTFPGAAFTLSVTAF